ncbi:hypothetical protein JCM10914A_09040 [Paenibacillus sp. JCM 10914]
MITARIVLAIQDSLYVEPLLDYVQASGYATAVQAKAFTQKERFLDYMNSGERCDLVVADAQMLEEWMNSGNSAVPWLLLRDEHTSSAAGEGGNITARYQPLPQLLEIIMRCCQGASVKKERLLMDSTPIIGVVSPIGGSGKSTVAMNMAKQFAVLGLRVFYLNLETVNSSLLFMGQTDGDKSFTRLMYDIKASQESPGKEQVSLASYIKEHEALKCDTFEPTAHIKELMEITSGDVNVLLTSLISSGQYDIIIADTDQYNSEAVQTVLQQAGLVLWILLDDMMSMHKTGMWIHQLEREDPVIFKTVMQRSRFVINRSAGGLVNQLPRHDMNVDFALPYIPSWKQLYQQDLLLCSPIFSREVLKYCKQMLEGADRAALLAVGGHDA